MAKVNGRPTLCTPEMIKEICDTISTSSQGLPTLCQMNSNWPGCSTIFEWISDNRNGFADSYAKAKESQADYLVDDILRIIDKPESFIDENGNERNDVAMMRLKVDAIKWQAMKLKPKKYDNKGPEAVNPQDTLNKIQALVADLNKTNVSDI